MQSSSADDILDRPPKCPQPFIAGLVIHPLGNQAKQAMPIPEARHGIECLLPSLLRSRRRRATRGRYAGTTLLPVLFVVLCQAGAFQRAEATQDESSPSADSIANADHLINGQSAHLNDLRSQLEFGSAIRIIVGLAPSDGSRGSRITASPTVRIATVARAQSEFRRRLAIKNLAIDESRSRFFKYIPYVAMVAGKELFETLSRDPSVVSIKEDKENYSQLFQSAPHINANIAWMSGVEAEGQTIAILDTGIDATHPFLSGRVVGEACFSHDLCPSGRDSQIGSGAGAPCTVEPDCAHGTHVAGIALGSGGDYEGRPFDGIAPRANVISVQVFSRAAPGSKKPITAYDSDILAGLEYVYGLSDPSIVAVNLSLGGHASRQHCDDESPATTDAIALLRSIGIATVVAAGNVLEPPLVNFPACISNSISVGGTVNQSAPDVVASESAGGPLVSLLAPGWGVYSSIPGGGYDVYSGTSMAAPHVAGAVALLRAFLPLTSSTAVAEVHGALKSGGALVTDSRNGIAIPRLEMAGAARALVSLPRVWASYYGTEAGGWTSQHETPRMVADVNGDGRADIIGFAQDGVHVATSKGLVFGSPELWSTYFGGGSGFNQSTPRMVADVNGDGRSDIIGFADDGVYVSLSTGCDFAPPEAWVRGFGGQDGFDETTPRTLADVNGDNLPDVVGFAGEGVRVSLSIGHEFAPPQLWVSYFGSAHGFGSVTPRTMADVNGDGSADVVGFAEDGVYVSLSTGHSFEAQELWVASYGAAAGGWTSEDETPRRLADVNGDGRSDIVGFASEGVHVSLSTGRRFSSPELTVGYFGASAGGWTSQEEVPRVLADVNGDGRADIVGFAADGVYLSESTGRAFQLPHREFPGDYGTDAGWASQDLYPRTLADVNGDGELDIVGFAGPGARVALRGCGQDDRCGGLTNIPISPSTPVPCVDACPGDCNGDGTVTVNELIVSVNIALGSASGPTCTPSDSNRNGMLEVNELVAAVNRLLSGC